MNPVQTGTPSSQLAPQGYKNSSQTGTVQSTLNASNVQSSTDDALRVPAQGKLQVVVLQTTPVLGINTTTTTQTQITTKADFPTVAAALMVASAVLAVYFIKRYRKFLTTEPEDNDQD